MLPVPSGPPGVFRRENHAARNPTRTRSGWCRIRPGNEDQIGRIGLNDDNLAQTGTSPRSLEVSAPVTGQEGGPPWISGEG